jgi:hypothetical protein
MFGPQTLCACVGRTHAVGWHEMSSRRCCCARRVEVEGYLMLCHLLRSGVHLLHICLRLLLVPAPLACAAITTSSRASPPPSPLCMGSQANQSYVHARLLQRDVRDGRGGHIRDAPREWQCPVIAHERPLRQ